MSNRVLIDQSNNTVTTDTTSTQNNVILSADNPNVVTVVENTSNIITIGVPGPRGPQGPVGPQSSYKVYIALLLQSDENAPIATVLENTLGGIPVWTRYSIGNYVATLEGAFPDGKTMCFYTHDGFNGNTGFGGLVRNDSDTVWMTFNDINGIYVDSGGLSDSIEIRVYN